MKAKQSTKGLRPSRSKSYLLQCIRTAKSSISTIGSKDVGVFMIHSYVVWPGET